VTSLLDHIFNAVIGIDGQEWAKEQREQARRLKDPVGFLLYESITRAKISAAYHSQQLELLLSRQSRTLDEFGRVEHVEWSDDVVMQIMDGLPRLPEGVMRFPIFQQVLDEVARITTVERQSLVRLVTNRLGSEEQAEFHRRRVMAVAALSRTWAGAFR